jgi:hypothetical protein
LKTEDGPLTEVKKGAERGESPPQLLMMHEQPSCLSLVYCAGFCFDATPPLLGAEVAVRQAAASRGGGSLRLGILLNSTRHFGNRSLISPGGPEDRQHIPIAFLYRSEYSILEAPQSNPCMSWSGPVI